MNFCAASTGRFPRREREQHQHKQDIFAAASELFARCGYEKTSIQQIADLAEFSVGKIYKHFPSKETLYRELMEGYCSQLLDVMTEATEGSEAPLRKLHLYVESVVDFFNDHRNFLNIYNNENPAALGGLFQETTQRTMEIVASLFEEAASRAEIREEDPRHLAVILNGSIYRLLCELTEQNADAPFSSIPELVFRIVLHPLSQSYSPPPPRLQD